MESLNYLRIGRRIRNKRKELNLTQEKLAEIINVSPSYISEIERGTTISSLSTINKISQSLDLGLDYLIYGIKESNSDSTFKELLKKIPKDQQNLFIALCENIASTLNNKEQFEQ